MDPKAPDPNEHAFAIREVLDAARSGDHSRAHELAGAALKRGVRHPALFDVQAGWFASRGRDGEALAALEAVRTYMPNDAGLLVRIGHLLIRLRRPQDALAILDSVIAARPGFAQAHYERGIALGMLADMEDMRRAHERTIELAPDHFDALASLAMIAARSGEAALARSYAARSQAGNPRGAAALAALAVADIVDGDFAAAEQKLDAVLKNPAANNDTRIDIALADAAGALDRRDQTSRAFALYAEVGERRRAQQMVSVEGSRAIDAIHRRVVWLRHSAAWSAPAPAESRPGAPASHIFLLGFMRSGTTLLETILAANPRVYALDEREFLAEPARLFLFTDQGLDRLAALEGDELVRWQETYWNAVRNTGGDISGKVFVNKMPFNSLRLPLIAKLFPDARILLAIRDPRDVVFSCFRHRFEPGHLTFEFLRPDDCARFYAATMELVDLCRQKMTLCVHPHHYEDMVRDFDGSVRAVCSFIGIEWNEAMREFVTAAGVIARRSQSAAQVRRGLYTGGIDQWRRYREQLAPVFPILQPWIERFGYAAD